VCEFPESQRVLAVVDRESALSVPYSMGNLVYHYMEPVLGLGDADKELLSAALGGATDVELAATLGIRVPAVKRRWFRIFERVEDVIPNLPRAAGEQESDGRGPQKRHHLLSYSRAHREELRPFPVKRRRSSA